MFICKNVKKTSVQSFKNLSKRMLKITKYEVY